MREVCLEFTLQVLTIASSMPLMRKLRRQVNNLGLAIQYQEYSKVCAKEGTASGTRVARARARHEQRHGGGECGTEVMGMGVLSQNIYLLIF